MTSQSSLNETGLLSSSEIYKLADLPGSMTLSGIELDTYLFNARTLRSFDTSLIVPMPIKQANSGMARVGQEPFVINLRIRAEGEDAIFNPFSTELHIEGSERAILPNEVYRDRAKLAACAYRDMPSNVGVEVTKGLVSIFDKYRVLTEKRVENEDWSVPH